jgi:glutaconate CoA-transferase subunit B
MQKYSSREIMAITAGRMIRNGDILFCGTGLSLIAATIAKKLYAPKSVIFFETGGIDTELPELPLAVADLRVMYGTSINAGLLESFSILGHRKLHTRAFLGAAQIDRYGNLNSTCIGEYLHPSVRFSGSGGGCDAACLAAEVIIFMEHKRDRFVEKLDYLTSPGWLSGLKARDRAGLYRGGPSTVVTDLGVMKFDENTKHMYLSEHYPGVSPEQVEKNTGFEIDVSRAVLAGQVTAEELRVLREEVDPQKLII